MSDSTRGGLRGDPVDRGRQEVGTRDPDSSSVSSHAIHAEAEPLLKGIEHRLAQPPSSLQYVMLPKDWVRTLLALVKSRDEEIAQWKTWGIIEIATRNVNVSSYMEHWEARAEAAEARLAILEAEHQQVKNMTDQRQDAFWVLEKSVDGKPAYWDGGHAEAFTFDINEAVQFCRKLDAWRSQRHLMVPPRWGWSLAEHAYMSSATTAESSLASLRARLHETEDELARVVGERCKRGTGSTASTD